ncbi:MAG TPA: hypothetical protein VJL39_01835 [Candidatus Paceibacterota bacterium]
MKKLDLLKMYAVPATPDGHDAWQLIRGDATPKLNTLTNTNLRNYLRSTGVVEGVVLNVDRSNKYKMILHVKQGVDAEFLEEHLTMLAQGSAASHDTAPARTGRAA